MSPLDNHLRAMLTEHADDVTGDPTSFANVQRRARQLQHRRAGIAAGGAAVLAGAGTVTGVAISHNGQHDTLLPPVGAATASPSPVPRTPTATATLPVAAGRYLDWPYRSGAGAASLDPASTVHPLWGGRLPNDTTVVVGQQVDDKGDVRAVAWVTPADDQPFQLQGAVLKPGTTEEVSFVLPGDEFPYVLVIGAPTTGQIVYAERDDEWSPVDTEEGVAVFTRTGTGQDRILVEDGDGEDLYLGHIDVGPSEPDY